MSFKKRFFLLLISISILSVFSCSQQQQALPETVNVPADQKTGHTAFQAAIAQFESEIAADVAEDGIGSISAAVVHGNEVIWARGFGWADIGRNIPADENTIYRTGSISKSFTAVLMMQVIEKGFFKLDDAAIEYFPQIAEIKEKPSYQNYIPHLSLFGIIPPTSLPVTSPAGAEPGDIAQWPTWYRFFMGVFDDMNRPFMPMLKVSRG